MAVLANSVPALGDLVSLLHSMYLKKLSGKKEMEVRELSLLAKLEHSKLLKVFVDPTTPIDFLKEKGYVPPRLELEMTYSAMTGKVCAKKEEDRFLMFKIYHEIYKVESANRLTSL
jgi:hypothetical protein